MSRLSFLEDRFKFWWESCGLLWKVLGIVYGIFGALTLFRDNFLSSEAQRTYATMAVLPRVSWKVWLISGVIIVLGAVLEGAYRAARRKDQTRPTEQPLPITATEQPKAATIEPAASLRPLVVPVRYGKNQLNRSGLLVRNDGEPAFDVSMENVQIGTSNLKFWNDFPSLTKGDGEVLFESNIELTPTHGLSGNGLRDEMVRQNLEAITAHIKYKNADNRWYITICKLERDFLHGIRAGYLSQELLPASTSPEPEQKGSKSQDKPETSDAIRIQWDELATRFEKLSTQTFAEHNCQRRNNTTVLEEWRIGGGDPNGYCETLCKRSGMLLLKSPQVLKNLSESTRHQSDPVWRWCYFLKENHRAFTLDGALPPIGHDGTIYLHGRIWQLALVSARVCLDCAALEL